MKKISVIAVIVLIGISSNVSCGFAELLFFDKFEYVVNRDNSPLPGNDPNNAFITQGGWTYTKADNLTGRGYGRLYTTNVIPGYSGSMPGIGSTRVLKMEAQNREGGTDFYLALAGGENKIPANVWFQWWIYINHYGSELSGLENRHKFIYPCDTDYPCNPETSMKWLVSFSANPYNTLGDSMPYGNPTTNGEAFVIIRDVLGPNYSPYPDNANKLGPNLQAVGNSYIKPNQWQLIKVNLDTSVANRGKFQVWIKPLGGEWRKVSEWIAGVTPNFTWTHSAGGHRGFRMPTTIGYTNTTVGGAYYYIDDFAMANTEDSLPVYGNSPNPSPSTSLQAPQNLRIQ